MERWCAALSDGVALTSHVIFSKPPPLAKPRFAADGGTMPCLACILEHWGSPRALDLTECQTPWGAVQLPRVTGKETGFESWLPVAVRP